MKGLSPLSFIISGMARFCTAKYAKPTVGNFTHLYGHLTNYSLNKLSAAYVHSATLRDQARGEKIRQRVFWLTLVPLQAANAFCRLSFIKWKLMVCERESYGTI